MQRFFIALIGSAFLVVSTHLDAQVLVKSVLEFNKESRHEDRLIIPVSESKKAISLQRNRKRSFKKTVFDYDVLNQDLEVVLKGEIILPDDFLIRAFFVDGREVFMLFQRGYISSDLEMAVLNADTHKLEQNTLIGFSPLEVIDLDVVKSSVIISGYHEGEAISYLYDWRANKMIRELVEVAFDSDRKKLLEVRRNNDEITFNVLILLIDQSDRTKVRVITIDFEGNLIRKYLLGDSFGDPYFNAVSSSIDSEDASQVLIGYFGDSFRANAAGLFINRIDRKKEPRTNRVPIENLNRLSTSVSNTQNSVQSNLYTGKNDVAVPMIRTLLEVDQKLLLLTEWYRPNRFIYYHRGRNINQIGFHQLRRFDRKESQSYVHHWKENRGGIYFSHATVMLVEKSSGKLVFNKRIEIDKFRSGVLGEFGAFHWAGNLSSYLIFDGNELSISQVDQIGNSKKVAYDLTAEISGEVIRRHLDKAGIIHWYDDNYLVFREDTVRPSSSRKKQRVFSILKLQISEPILN